MPADLERFGVRSLVRPSARTARALAHVDHHATVRLAAVQAEGIIQSAKVHEVDAVTREAITGQAMLAKWASTVAAGDPFLADDLRFLTEVAKIGKGEIIADLISTYCRESGR